MAKPAKFKDLNFKLAVLEQLMYREKLLPAFDVKEFIKERGTKVSTKYDYKPVPGVLKYFRDYEIPAGLLEKVEKLDQGYHTIYHQIIPYWDGEGDEFNITSTEDLQLVPNLKSIVLLYDREQKMAGEFTAKGIAARYL